MENVILIVHLLLALGLIAVVLMQRSEGGGLGMGSGGGGGGVMTGRSAATALSKVTWFLAVAFICTSIAMTIIAAQNSAGSSVIDRLGVPAPASNEDADGTVPTAPLGSDLLPPSEGDNAPLVPRAD
ncbi:MAG: preprotein translocase subunit SecG [Pseudomonadota bacterium]